MFYDILKPLAWLISRTVVRLKVYGAEKIPADRPVILCSNHISFLDFLYIGTSVKAKLSFLGKSEIIKNKIVGAFLKSLGFIPISRGQADLGAIRNVIESINGGRSLLVFIQGTRKKGVKVRDTSPKKGVALIQKKTLCPIYPVSVTTKTMKILPFSKVCVRFGDEISPNAFENMNEAESAKLIFDKIISLSEE